MSGPIGSLTYDEAARGQSVDHTAPTSSQPGPAPSQGSLSLHQQSSREGTTTIVRLRLRLRPTEAS